MSDLAVLSGGWEPLLRILVVGTAMYLGLVVLLRVSGSRTIASMRAFDFIVTVALGSVFGGALIGKTVSLAEALVALLLLVGLQYAVAWLQVRSRSVARVVTSPPVLLYFRGEFQRAGMRRARITEAELRAVIRKQGQGSLDDVQALVLEASGDIAVISTIGDGSALDDSLRAQRRGPDA